MKKINKTLSVTLLMLGLVSIGAGASYVAKDVNVNPVKAQAELYPDWTCTLDALNVIAGSTSSELYVTAQGEVYQLGAEFPFTLHEDGRVGFALNGEAFTPALLEVSNDNEIHIQLGFEAQEGDVLTVNGAFSNDDAWMTIDFNECALQFVGGAWSEVADTPETPDGYTTYNIGSLVLHVNSKSFGAAKDWSHAIFLQRADEQELPFSAWENPFVFESGVGFKVNGEAATLIEMQSADGTVYLNFGEKNVGDIITIGGTFVCENQKIKYVIEECSFKWLGEGWEVYEEPAEIVYTTYTINKLGVAGGCTENVLYVYPAEGDALPSGDWDNRFSFEAGSGNGIQMNGAELAGWELKQPGDFYFAWGEPATAGATFTIDGTFYNEATAKKFVFNNCKVVFDGTAWTVPADEPEVPEIVYKTYNINKLGIANGCTENVLYVYPAEGDALPSGDWDNRFSFEAGSGNGIQMNGAELAGWEMKQPGDFYFAWGEPATAGDTFTIDGTFYNEATAKKFVFNNCKVVFDGTAWSVPADEPVVEYTTHNIGKLVLHVNSKSFGAAKDWSHAIFLQRADEQELPFSGWENPFVFESGVGFKVNGEAATLLEMQSADGTVYLNFGEKNVGDIITIGGTFVCENQKIKYVIEECSFKWLGEGWEVYEEPTEIVYTTYNINKLGVAGGCNEQVLNLYVLDGDTLPEGDWDNAFSLEAGSGEGLKLNDTVLSVWELKQPGDFYFSIVPAAEEGDTLTINGTFYNEATAKKFVINNCTLVFDGENWSVPSDNPDTPVEYTTHNIGSLVLHVNSKSFGAAKDWSHAIFLQRADEQELPFSAWENPFVFESGVGFKVNGEAATLLEMQSADGTVYLNFGEKNVGDIITIGGTFVCENQKIKYVIEECSFKWLGEGWEVYEEPAEIVYTTYTINKLGVAGGCNEQVLYLYVLDGDTLPEGDWDNAFSLEAGSGEGLKLNDTVLSVWELKQPGDFYFSIVPAAEEGDTLTINGTFYNEATAKKFVINNCKVVFDGTAWSVPADEPENPDNPDNPDTPDDPDEYEICNVGTLLVKDGNASALYFKSASGVEMPVDSWDFIFWFVEGSGVKLTLNGTVLDTNDIKSPNHTLYVGLGVTAMEDDILTIGGSFKNEETKTIYTIEESSFVFDGTSWKIYGASYTTHNVGELVLHVNSKPIGGAGSLNDQIYLERADGEALPITSWDYAFTVGEDGYFKMNGEVVTPNAIKSTGDGFYWAFEALEAGDVITIGGTFVCETLAQKYVIEESSFAWTGSNWKVYIEYTDYDLGTMHVLPDSTASQLYLRSNNDVELPISDWDVAYAFAYGYGNGITLNGTMIYMTNSVKSVGGSLFIDLGIPAVAGDVLAIGGSLTCDNAGVQYLLDDMTFVFDGTVWLDQLGIAQRDAKAVLDAYMDNFAEADYYASEWESFADIIARGKASIDSAISEEEINAIVEATKAEMDGVVTKEESDASFDTLRANAITAVSTYKNENDYKAEQWTAIQAIIEKATAEINASTSVTAMNNAVAAAKAEMDAVKTSAQIDAEEAAVAAAKSEVENYKSESDYKAEQWTAIQAIIASANAAIDNAIGNQTEIDSIVATAKAEMDAVKTSAQIDAEEAAVAAAKAELDGYKSESDYKAEQWTAIQDIIAAAKEAIDTAIGNQEAIDGLVASAKAEIDMLPTAAEVDAAALAAAKTAAKEEVRAYYNAIDLDLYSDEALSEIGGYVSAANAAIDAAATEAEINAAVAQYKTNVESVAKVQQGGNSSSTSKSSGCGSTASALAAGLTLAAAAGVVAIRKKKDNE